MYIVVLDWYSDEDYEPNYRHHVIPAASAEVALNLANYICRDKEGYEKYDSPKNLYLYDIDYATSCYKNTKDAYSGYDGENGYLACWTDIDTYIKW